MATTLRNLLVIVSLFFASLCSAAAPISSVPADQALRDATLLASLRPDWSVYQAAGDSMEPFYGGNSLLIVQQADTTHLQPGMIAVYRDAAGDLVGHQVLRTGEKIEAKGANNAVVDPSPITDANLVGIVVGMMHASGTAANDLQVVNGKRY